MIHAWFLLNCHVEDKKECKSIICKSLIFCLFLRAPVNSWRERTFVSSLSSPSSLSPSSSPSVVYFALFPVFFIRWDQSSFHRLFSFLLLNLRDMLWQVGCFVAVKGWLFCPPVSLSLFLNSRSFGVVLCAGFAWGGNLRFSNSKTPSFYQFFPSTPPYWHWIRQFCSFC